MGVKTKFTIWHIIFLKYTCKLHVHVFVFKSLVFLNNWRICLICTGSCNMHVNMENSIWNNIVIDITSFNVNQFLYHACADPHIFLWERGLKDSFVCQGIRGLFSVILQREFNKFKFPGLWSELFPTNSMRGCKEKSGEERGPGPPLESP